MNVDRRVLDLLDSFASINGVRGSLVATDKGAVGGTLPSGLDKAHADDLARTVRRMVLGSISSSSPLAEMVVSFGAIQMYVRPIAKSSTLVVLYEGIQARTEIQNAAPKFCAQFLELFKTKPKREQSSTSSTIRHQQEASEIEFLKQGKLGLVIQKVETCFRDHQKRHGVSNDAAGRKFADCLNEWTCFSDPSPYSFPLLLDSLSQAVSQDQDVRTLFAEEVQQIMHESNLWALRGMGRG